MTLDDAIAFLDPERMTGAHSFANRWLCRQVAAKCGTGGRILDFGCRYSPLPALFASLGYRVCAVDRDPKVELHQAQWKSQFGSQYDVMLWSDEDGLAPDLKFDLIVACWAIQHNPPFRQSAIARMLGDALAPGGVLLIVSSYAPEWSFHQAERADPQWVLNDQHRKATIIEPSGLTPDGEPVYFRYEHGRPIAAACEPTQANAICYSLAKPTTPKNLPSFTGV